MSWDDLGSGGGKFLKLEPNVTHAVRFVGDADRRREHYDEAAGRSSDCTGPGCALCARGVRASDRYYFDVETTDGDRKIAGSYKLANAIVPHRRRLGPDAFADAWFLVTRKGMGKSTDYVCTETSAPAPGVKSDDIPF